MSLERVWFIGDTHFYHNNVIRYCNRPFQNVEEMNNYLITNWNKTINKEDRVFMMGDFALCGKDNIIEIGNKLQGRKILLLGNHDSASRTTYQLAGFENVYYVPILFENFILSHYPIDDCKYNNIHAHSHNKRVNDKTHFCTSVEMINYKPINFNVIKDYFSI